MVFRDIWIFFSTVPVRYCFYLNFKKNISGIIVWVSSTRRISVGGWSRRIRRNICFRRKTCELRSQDVCVHTRRNTFIRIFGKRETKRFFFLLFCTAIRTSRSQPPLARRRNSDAAWGRSTKRL